MVDEIYKHVSLRFMGTEGVGNFLKDHPLNFNIEDVSYFFGFTADECLMYGGRKLEKRYLNVTEDVLDYICGLGINYRINLTNRYGNLEDFESCRPLLEKYYRPGNGVTITRDDFAVWMKNNYPEYKRTSSVVKNNCSIRHLKKCIESGLYDLYVLPPWCSVWYDYLKKIPNSIRKNIVLFGCCSCQSTCQLQECQGKISRTHKGIFDKKHDCCNTTIHGIGISNTPLIHYDIQPLINMGFRHFKYVDC